MYRMKETLSGLENNGNVSSWMMAKFTIMVIAGAVVMVLTMLWQQVHYADLSRELSQLEREQTKLIAEAKALQVEKELYGSPQRIARIATQELGMKEPAYSGVHFLECPPPPACEETEASPKPPLLGRWSSILNHVARLLVGIPSTPSVSSEHLPEEAS